MAVESQRRPPLGVHCRECNCVPEVEATGAKRRALEPKVQAIGSGGGQASRRKPCVGDGKAAGLIEARIEEQARARSMLVDLERERPACEREDLGGGGLQRGAESGG
jgi:hypothetical protein